MESKLNERLLSHPSLSVRAEHFLVFVIYTLRYRGPGDDKNVCFRKMACRFPNWGSELFGVTVFYYVLA